MPTEIDAETLKLLNEVATLRLGDNGRYEIQEPQITGTSATESPVIVATETHSASPSTTTAIPLVIEPAAGIKSPTISNEKYNFPIDDSSVVRIRENLQHMSNEQLLEVLRKTSYGKLSSTGDFVPYSRLRPIICAVGILLNDLGQTAPRFRLIRKVKNFKSSENRNYSNDLQVLDLHWLSLHAKVSPEPQWKEMFGSSLSFKGASKFVETLGMAETKATSLSISEPSQLMLLVIQTKAVADRWATINAGKKSADTLMRSISTKMTSRFDAADIPARCDEYVALRIGRGSPTAAAEILPRIAGATSTTRLMRKRKDWFTDNKISVAD
jgi:hypothetical protein